MGLHDNSVEADTQTYLILLSSSIAALFLFALMTTIRIMLIRNTALTCITKNIIFHASQTQSCLTTGFVCFSVVLTRSPASAGIANRPLVRP